MPLKKNLDNEDGPILDGRKYHNVKDSTYWLPKDEDEQVRLKDLHLGFKMLYSSNLSPEAFKFTNFEDGVRCLDIGCGPGHFVMDMAKEYPKSYFVGVDIAAMFDSQKKLENTEFGLGNVITGLPFPDNSFDFIHMRLFMAALRRTEWPIAIKEIYRLLKPGGGVQLCELYPRETGSEICQKVMGITFSMMRGANQAPDAADNLKIWLEEACFRQIKSDVKSVDIGEDVSCSKQWRRIWEQTFVAASPHLGPLLGAEKEDIKEFSKNFLKEGTSSHATLHFNRCLGRKPLEYGAKL